MPAETAPATKTQTSQLDHLRKHSQIVADTANVEAINRFQPQDATTNPRLDSNHSTENAN